MTLLEKPISNLPKIGPKYRFLFSRLEINTIKDLLYHFPFRYEDYSVINNIKNLESGNLASIEGKVMDVKNIFTKYGKKLTKVKASDSSGTIEMVWMNQLYVSNSLRIGETYNFRGKVTTYLGKKTFFSPEFESVTDNLSSSNKIMPIYPETAGITSKFIRSRINDVLKDKIFQEQIEENINSEILTRHNLISRFEALKKIHFPSSIPESEIARRRFGFEEIYTEMIQVESRKRIWKKAFKSPSIKVTTSEHMRFISTLPFKLTSDQESAVQEILADMSRSIPMNRLLEGDVGTGKTLVAVCAAYHTIKNGLKVLYMAPTEILAEQHSKTFEKLLTDSRIQIITGNRKGKTPDNYDVIIGTHALLFQQKFHNIGLIIIDEQHRFGVEQRGKIISLTQHQEDFKPHVLSMTATPIPRTMALTIYGDLDISVLRTPPNKDKKIITRVISKSQREKTYEWIKDKGEQTFIVCPLIAESESESLENVKSAEKEFNTLKNGVFKNIDMGLLHGRMKQQEKESVINAFRNGKIQILVSTPVIEVGVDIPEASIMVIESAERYGLASLHQLRGRVGRGSKAGYCLIFMSEDSKANGTRLRYLEDISDGLKLAEIDLKYRGSGDIFGTLQHGFKKFKVADFSDLKLVESAKIEAQNTIGNMKEEDFKRINKFVENN